jgi:zinc/manganese transport system substrate-binding protein
MKPLPLAFSLSALLLAAPATAADVRVVASFSILGDMVHAVGGDRVEVTTIVGPDADTHVYEPKPSDAVAMSKADLVVVNGLGFEGWVDRLKGASGYTGAWVVATDGVAAHAMAEADHDDDAEHGEDEHAHEGELDPHAWQSLSNGAIYVENIRKGLCTADAAGCETYSANAKAYVESMMALDSDVRARIDAVPMPQRKVITSHDAFGYFADAYGVAFLAPEGVSTDAEPSAAGVARLIIQIRSEGVKALFLENMSDPRLISQIAKETGIVPGGTLYADALSSADGPAATYLDMFAHNAALLTTAMSNE